MTQQTNRFADLLRAIHCKSRTVVNRGGEGRKADSPRRRLLTSGRIMRFVVENDVKEIRRLIQANCGEPAQLHQGGAISIDNDNWLPGECVRHTETNRGRSAHSADDVEMVGAVHDCEEFAARLASRSNDRFITGESV